MILLWLKIFVVLAVLVGWASGVAYLYSEGRYIWAGITWASGMATVLIVAIKFMW